MHLKQTGTGKVNFQKYVSGFSDFFKAVKVVVTVIFLDNTEKINFMIVLSGLIKTKEEKICNFSAFLWLWNKFAHL